MREPDDGRVITNWGGHSHPRLSFFKHAAHQFGSTMRCQAGIFVDVHSFLLRTLTFWQHQIPRFGPSGQSVESSQIAAANRLVPGSGHGKTGKPWNHL